MIATLAREAPAYGAQFFTYELLKRKIFFPGCIFGPKMGNEPSSKGIKF
jgi:hypothetical protein